MERVLVVLLFAVVAVSDGYRVNGGMDTGMPVAPVAPMVLKRQIVDSEEEAQDSEEERRELILREMENIIHLAEKRNTETEEREMQVSRREKPRFFNQLKGMVDDNVDLGSWFGKRRVNVDTQCKKPYSQVSTMCAYPDDPNVKEKGVSDADKQVILDEHNKFRAKVNPSAKAMQKMYWCPELEALAQKWAQVCYSSFHDKNEQRVVPGWGISVGQNAARGQKNWNDVVAAWHSEIEFFRYGATYGSDWGKIGHYTQVVRDIATCVGCGYAKCPKGPTYICNYAFGNPFLDKIGFPYEKGSSCSDCPGKCSGNLCDCKGLVCKNGGTLDPKSCTCKCKGKLWTGKDCSQQNKAACKDPDYCNKPQPMGFQGKCKVYSNVPEECPKMCGVC